MDLDLISLQIITTLFSWKNRMEFRIKEVIMWKKILNLDNKISQVLSSSLQKKMRGLLHKYIVRYVLLLLNVKGKFPNNIHGYQSIYL